jgi:hypothetical protein
MGNILRTIKSDFMKTTKLMWCALCAAVLAAVGLVGCEEIDTYTVKSPADLQSKIDSIAAAKAGRNTGDTTYLTIATALVGAEDNSNAWNGAHSDYFTIPAGKILHMEFVNHGSGANNWNNWNLAVNKVETNSEDYDPNNPGTGYFTLRADAYGWGSTMADVDPSYAFDGNMITNDYPDTDGNGDVWNDFKTTMEGAYVTMEVDHAATGSVYVTATAVGTNGTTLVEKYQQSVSATEDIVAYLVTDGSHFQMKKAYLLPSQVKDANPTSIAITGAPASVELGNKNFWGDAIATVKYADGSSKQVDSVDLSFNVIPDMTTLGIKTVVVSYSKTRQGVYTQAVSTIYTLAVTNAVVSIAASDINYYYFSSDDIVFKPEGIVVTATYSDGSTATLPNNVLDFDHPATIPSTAGSQNVDITYVGLTSTFNTTSTVTLVKGVGQVGANNFSTPFWTNSADYTVASGSSKTFTFYCYSDNLENWHSPYTILRKADNTEYAVVRMDSFGWGSGYGAATVTSDWDWDIFKSSISSSKIVITVTNKGDNTADILYNVTYATGATHFQKYAGITINSADLTCAVGAEGAYLVFVD